jgi:hypothetical protein
MTMTDTTAAPFPPWLVMFLLAGPAAATRPTDPAAREEFKRVWGRHGERCGKAWIEHEAWLRQAALERSIQPKFNGRFFSEALSMEGKQR